MWRPILQQKAKKQTNQTTKKQENKANLNYLKFLAFLMQTEPFWILMNIILIFEGSNSSQLTRKCF